MNGYFLDEALWDEEWIQIRGRELLQQALKIWARPQEEAGQHQQAADVELALEIETEPEPVTAKQLLPAALSAFEKAAPNGLKLVGRGKTYRQVRVEGWPADLHYEFSAHDEVFGVDLHVELAEGHPLRDRLVKQLDSLLPVVRQGFPGFEGKRLNKRTWRWPRVEIPVGAVPGEQLGAGMLRLIDLTKSRMDGVVRAAANQAAD